jgi:hypothetical protein
MIDILILTGWSTVLFLLFDRAIGCYACNLIDCFTCILIGSIEGHLKSYLKETSDVTGRNITGNDITGMNSPEPELEMKGR